MSFIEFRGKYIRLLIEMSIKTVCLILTLIVNVIWFLHHKRTAVGSDLREFGWLREYYTTARLYKRIENFTKPSSF